MLLSRFSRCTVAGLLLAAAASVAVASGPRILGRVDAGAGVALADGVSLRVALAQDLGVASGDAKLEGMTLRFAMTAAQQKALSQLLADQQNPDSGRYHQWLTPEQFAAQFGMAASDLAKVSGWLTAQGFAVTEVARGGTFVRFSGTVAQVQSAFKTRMHVLSLNGQKHLANVSAPVLPAALAAVTAGVTGLDDFHPKAQGQTSTVTSAAGGLKPLYTSSGTNYLAPGDFYTIYDEKGLLTSKITGTGITIAVIGQSDISAADIAAFRAAAGLTASVPAVTLYGSDPGSPAADVTTAETGLEWAGAVAPGASLVYVNSIDAKDGSLTEAIDNDLAPIVLDNYGDCEADLGATTLAYYTTILQQANAQGQTIVSGSGNAGATACDTTVASAAQGLAVTFPASSPMALGVGGTEFSEGSATYWSTTNGTNGGSALSYIPETAWNDDSSSGLASSGGGASLYFPKPNWQVGTGIPTDYSRDVPDVSMSASLAHDGYLACINGSCTNGFANASGGLTVVGGTAASASAFAGLLALVEQKTGQAQGNATPVLYALANSSYAGAVFHDVTTGNNESPCTTGSAECSSGGPIGYTANAGYDLATGWGSVDAGSLVNDWALVTPVSTNNSLTPSVTTLAGSATSVVTGNSVTLTVTVASGILSTTTTPTGTAQITVDNVAFGSGVALSNGTGTYTLFPTGLSLGTHLVQATYTGDSTFAGSKGSFWLTITTSNVPDFTITPSTTAVTVKSGTIAPAVTITVGAVNGFTGNVTLIASATALQPDQYSFNVNPVAAGASANFTVFAYTSPVASLRYEALGGVALAGLLMVVLPRRRRLAGLLVLCMSVMVVGVSGCSSTPLPTTAPGTTVVGTPAGTYTVLIIGTGTVNGATVSHNFTLTYTVQ